MCSNDPRKPASPYRRAAAALLGAATLALAACQTTPTAPTAPPMPEAPQPTRASQIDAVRELGFSETNDGWLLSLPDAILFNVNSDTLTTETQTRIAKMAQDLLRAGVRRLRIEGHTDNLGNRTYNAELSKRRADAVAQAFVANGFAPDAIERRGMAFDFPVASNATPDGRGRNRRVTVMVASEDLAAR
jgi:outer membrane protein OmpA-like peptidoglycan-associated protein